MIAISNNYLANVPEVIELARAARAIRPEAFVFVGGHSASFVARELLEHAGGAIDCVLKGEGETSMVRLLDGGRRRATAGAARGARRRDAGRARGRPRDSSIAWRTCCPPATCCGIAASTSSACSTRALDRVQPGLSLGLLVLQRLDVLRPELPHQGRRGGRRRAGRIREPGVFIVDDVAFIQGEHGMAIGEAIARRGIRKQFYLETRGDVLLRNKDVFRFWKTLGLQYMFLGVEAIDEEGLKRFRKRVTLSKNFEAIEFARSLGIMVAINIIADPRGITASSR